MNLYGFAGGDPVNFSDPFGLCPIEKDGIPCGAGGAAIGAGVGFAAGVALSAGCAGVTAGLCGIAAPGITGVLTGLGAGIGGLVHTAITLANSGEEASSPTNGEIVDAVGKSGAQVKPHKTKTGEGTLINWPDGSITDIRVENHPIPGSKGKPVKHGNVDHWDPSGNKVIEKHIP